MASGRTWHLKLVSVLMALLLWLFITNESLIIKQQMISGVKLEAININSGLVASYPEEVGVSIVGTPRTAREISAYIDLKGKAAGVYRIPVKVRSMPGTRVSAISPAEVQVEITEIQEIVFPVSYKIEKEPPEGFRVAAVEVSPIRCAVRGSQKEVKRIASLVIRLDLSSLRDTGAIASIVFPVDRNGSSIDSIEVLPSQVQAYVVIEKKQEFGKASVNPVLTGDPAEGYEARVLVEPKEITLLGTDEAISALSTIDTKPLDISGREKSFQQEIELVEIPGVTIFPSKVLCMIEIEKTRGLE